MVLVITATPTPPADPTAVFGRRILAWSIDFIILIVILVVVFANMATSQNVGSTSAATAACDILNSEGSNYLCIASGESVILSDSGDIGLLVLIALVYGLATHAILPGITGFSPGKAIVGLRVVNSETFALAGLGANMLRWILWLVDGIPFLAPLVGLITGLAGSGHRRVGDMAAKTIVIDKKWVDHPLAIAGVNSVPMLAATPFGTTPPPPGPTPFGATPTPPPPFAAATPPPPPGTMPLAPGVPPVMPVTPPTPPAPSPPPPAAYQPPPPEPQPPAPVATPPPPMPEPPAPAAPTPVSEPQPPATPASVAPLATPPEPPPAPEAEPVPPVQTPTQPGVEAPQWDVARDTYIQFDPELAAWMEWNEASGAWIPISQ